MGFLDGIIGTREERKIKKLRKAHDVQELNRCLREGTAIEIGLAANALGGIFKHRGRYQGPIGDASSIPYLNEALQDDFFLIRIAVLDALESLANYKKIGDPSSIPIINKCLEDKKDVVKCGAASALGVLAKINIGDPSSLPFLYKNLNDPDDHVRKNAARALKSLWKNMGIGNLNTKSSLDDLKQ